MKNLASAIIRQKKIRKRKLFHVGIFEKNNFIQNIYISSTGHYRFYKSIGIFTAVQWAEKVRFALKVKQPSLLI